MNKSLTSWFLSFCWAEIKFSFHIVLLILCGFIRTDLRPTGWAPQVSYFPKGHSRGILHRHPLQLHNAIALHAAWSCIDFFLQGPSFKQITPFFFVFFLFLRVAMGPIKKKKNPSVFHFQLEDVLWQMESFFKSFLPLPAFSFCFHPPVPHIFQPEMPGIKPV